MTNKILAICGRIQEYDLKNSFLARSANLKLRHQPYAKNLSQQIPYTAISIAYIIIPDIFFNPYRSSIRLDLCRQCSRPLPLVTSQQPVQPSPAHQPPSADPAPWREALQQREQPLAGWGRGRRRWRKSPWRLSVGIPRFSCCSGGSC